MFPVGLLIFAQCQFLASLTGITHHHSQITALDSGAESILADDDIAFARAVHFG